MYLQMTVADHEWNGFITLVRWSSVTEDVATDLFKGVKTLVCKEALPCPTTSPYWFMIDLMVDDNTCCGEIMIDTQTASRLAPEHVAAWLASRPDPEIEYHKPIPVIAGQPI